MSAVIDTIAVGALALAAAGALLLVALRFVAEILRGKGGL